MSVVIIGAGMIGASIAEFLVEAGKDVIVIDRDKSRLASLESMLDIQTIQGEGCDAVVLHAAQVEQAELVLALTGSEDANVLAASSAKHMGARKSVARAHSAHFLKPDGFDYRQVFNIDLMLSPEMLTAAEVVKFLDNPDALALEFYAQGKVQLLQFELAEGHPYCGHPLREIRLPGGVLVVLVTRGTEVLIPKGETHLMAGDKITLLGKRGTLAGMHDLKLKSTRENLGVIMIAGGGETGSFIAATLETRALSVKLVEIDPERCRVLAARHDHATVLHGDATNRVFLTEERIENTDVFIASMESDEDNIMASLLAKKMGVRKCVAVVKRPDYTPILLEATEIDLALSPRQVTAAKILSLVKRGLIKNISLLEGGKAEVIEFTPGEDSPLLDKPLQEIVFPPGCLVCMINHGQSIRVPRGGDQIRWGDTVIMVSLAEVSAEVEKLF